MGVAVFIPFILPALILAKCQVFHRENRRAGTKPEPPRHREVKEEEGLATEDFRLRR